MNWRAVGCGTLAAAAFVGIGLFGISRATAPAECPASLPYQPASYQTVGAPTGSPQLDGVGSDLERAGSASFGLASWDVWVEPGRVPAAATDPLPERIVLDCRDGTFQAYGRPSS